MPTPFPWKEIVEVLKNHELHGNHFKWLEDEENGYELYWRTFWYQKVPSGLHWEKFKVTWLHKEESKGETWTFEGKFLNQEYQNENRTVTREKDWDFTKTNQS